MTLTDTSRAIEYSRKIMGNGKVHSVPEIRTWIETMKGDEGSSRQSSVGSAIYQLSHKGEIIRIGRGCYQKAENIPCQEQKELGFKEICQRNIKSAIWEVKNLPGESVIGISDKELKMISLLREAAGSLEQIQDTMNREF